MVRLSVVNTHSFIANRRSGPCVTLSLLDTLISKKRRGFFMPLLPVSLVSPQQIAQPTREGQQENTDVQPVPVVAKQIGLRPSMTTRTFRPLNGWLWKHSKHVDAPCCGQRGKVSCQGRMSTLERVKLSLGGCSA